MMDKITWCLALGNPNIPEGAMKKCLKETEEERKRNTR